jgi:predicted O-methyltransferase YrrM
MAMESLKERGLVGPDASFSHDAPGGLRSEVAYRDFDFLSRLCRVAEAETVDSILTWLRQNGIVDQDAGYDESAFDELRAEVKGKFSVPGTSISPVMERLLYMLAAVKRPQRTIGLGTYCGNALVWIVGPSCGANRTYQAEKVYGIDIDPEATEQAQANLDQIALTDHVELLAEDGMGAVERLDGPFDLVFLDVDSKELGKGLYLELLTRLYDKLGEGAWVLAHDVVVPSFADQLEGYLAYVRDGERFSESILFDVDAYGLELSIK